MAGLVILLALALVGLEIGAFIPGLGPTQHRVAGALDLALVSLMSWQLATEVPGLARTGWTSVGERGGAGVQALVVLLLMTLPAAAFLHFACARTALDGPVRSTPAAALGSLGVVSSFFIAALSFIE